MCSLFSYIAEFFIANMSSNSSSSFSSPKVGVGLGTAAHKAKFLRAQELAKGFLRILKLYADEYPPSDEEETHFQKLFKFYEYPPPDEDPNTLGYYYSTLTIHEKDRKDIDELVELTGSKPSDWNFKTAKEFTERTEAEADLKIIKII